MLYLKIGGFGEKEAAIQYIQPASCCAYVHISSLSISYKELLNILRFIPAFVFDCWVYLVVVQISGINQEEEENQLQLVPCTCLWQAETTPTD